LALAEAIREENKKVAENRRAELNGALLVFVAVSLVALCVVLKTGWWARRMWLAIPECSRSQSLFG
jgi:hypothetical protein